MTQPLLVLLAVVQIGAGLFGLWLSSAMVGTTLGSNPSAAFIGVVGGIAYAAAVAGGVLLLMRRQAGWRISTVIQAMQVLLVSSPALTYYFIAGYLVGPRISARLGYSWQLGCFFEFSLGDPTAGTAVGLNLGALAALFLLRHTHPARAAAAPAAPPAEAPAPAAE